jgi:nicotinamide mononucleotide transporter PnuC
MSQKGAHAALKTASKKLTAFELAYLLCSYAVLVSCTAIFRTGLWALVAALFSITGGILNMRASRLCYPFYIVSVSIYGAIAFSQKFYGEVVLNFGYNLPLYILAVIAWAKNRKKSEAGTISALKLKHLAVILAASAVITVAYGWALARAGSALPYLNSFGTCMCAAACYLTSRRVREQWWFWMIYNSTLIAMWASTLTVSAEQLALFLHYLLYAPINVIGVIRWNRMYKAQTQNKA